MATLYTHQDENIRRTWIFMSAFFLLVIGFGYLLSLYYRDTTILFIFVIFSTVLNIGSYWFSDKIVLSMAGAHPVKIEEYRDLYNIVENLSITAGLPMPKLYVIDDPQPNAFATGRNKDHSAVAVTTGLLSMLTKSELEGVIAHELSHIGNRDMLISTVVVVLVGFISLLSRFFLRTSRFGGGNDRKGSPLIFILVILGVVLAPIAGQLMRLAISRKREFLADASGALLTRYPEGLASALDKIGKSGIVSDKANSAISHLYFDDPLREDDQEKAGFFTKIFMTHPPINERIKALTNN